MKGRGEGLVLGCTLAPEGLGGGEILLEEELEAGVEGEQVLVAVRGGLGVVPEPGEVFGVVPVNGDLGGVDLRAGSGWCEERREEEGGELEIGAHGLRLWRF